MKAYIVAYGDVSSDEEVISGVYDTLEQAMAKLKERASKERFDNWSPSGRTAYNQDNTRFISVTARTYRRKKSCC